MKFITLPVPGKKIKSDCIIETNIETFPIKIGTKSALTQGHKPHDTSTCKCLVGLSQKQCKSTNKYSQPGHCFLETSIEKGICKV